MGGAGTMALILFVVSSEVMYNTRHNATRQER